MFCINCENEFDVKLPDKIVGFLVVQSAARRSPTVEADMVASQIRRHVIGNHFQTARVLGTGELTLCAAACTLNQS